MIETSPHQIEIPPAQINTTEFERKDNDEERPFSFEVDLVSHDQPKGRTFKHTSGKLLPRTKSHKFEFLQIADKALSTHDVLSQYDSSNSGMAFGRGNGVRS